jgi:hypothetical protein
MIIRLLLLMLLATPAAAQRPKRARPNPVPATPVLPDPATASLNFFNELISHMNTPPDVREWLESVAKRRHGSQNAAEQVYEKNAEEGLRILGKGDDNMPALVFWIREALDENAPGQSRGPCVERDDHGLCVR